MRTSIAIWLFVGIAIGAFVAGLIRFGNFLDGVTPVGRVVLMVVVLIVGLGALGAYFHSKKDNSY
jgi:uncharacterized membrane protein YidH (DUF202 family)